MGQHLAAVEPVEREQPSGRQFGPGTRHADDIGAVEHGAVERDVLGLAAVIQFLAHPRADLLADFAGVDRRIEPPPDRQQPLQLLQIGFDRGLHVGILQLAGQHRAVERAGAVHLAERRGRRRTMLEACKPLRPVGAELGHHAALDEGPAHRRRFALQFLQLGGVFRRQQIRNGRHQLGDLHQRALEPPQRRRQRACVAGTIGLAAEEAPAGIARRHAADIGADPRIARRAGGETVLFAVWLFRFRHCAHGKRKNRCRQPKFSSSSIRRSITPNPPCQNAGSRALSPNGASNSA